MAERGTDCYDLDLAFTSDLVTSQAAARPAPQQDQTLVGASSLVTVGERISLSAQDLAAASSLVTGARFSALLAHNRDLQRATPGHGGHAGGRRNNAGFLASAATDVGSPACSPSDTSDRNNISVVQRCGDRNETASGNIGSDVVGLFSPDRVLLTHIMPSRPPVHLLNEYHRQRGDHHCHNGIVITTSQYS